MPTKKAGKRGAHLAALNEKHPKRTWVECDDDDRKDGDFLKPETSESESESDDDEEAPAAPRAPPLLPGEERIREQARERKQLSRSGKRPIVAQGGIASFFRGTTPPPAAAAAQLTPATAPGGSAAAASSSAMAPSDKAPQPSPLSRTPSAVPMTSPASSAAAPPVITDECAICQQPICVDATGPLAYYQLDGCRHIFHAGCINKWFRQAASRGTCPTCRGGLPAAGAPGDGAGSSSTAPDPPPSEKALGKQVAAVEAMDATTTTAADADTADPPLSEKALGKQVAVLGGVPQGGPRAGGHQCSRRQAIEAPPRPKRPACAPAGGCHGGCCFCMSAASEDFFLFCILLCIIFEWHG